MVCIWVHSTGLMNGGKSLMTKYNFYIGYWSPDCEDKGEVVFEDEEFEDQGKILKLLRALKEIYKYLTKGHIND